MGAVASGAILIAVLLLIVAGFIWQGARSSTATDYAEYRVQDVIGFVDDRLSDRAHGRLDRRTVRNILEWNLHFTQVEGPRRLGRPVLIGSGEGIEYVMERAVEAGVAVDPIDIAEIMAIETDYLLDIGAIGGPAEDDPG